MFEADRSRPRSSEQAPQLRVVAGEPGPPHWTGLADAGNEAVFCSAWLSSQCTRISGIIAGLLMMPPPAKGLSVASTSWPQRNPYIEDLLRLAERASLERRAIVSPGRMGSDTSVQPVGLFVALPLGPGSQPIAVAAVALASGSSAALAPESVAEQLRWGAGWLEALPWARRSKDASTDVARAASCLDLLAAIGEQPRLQGMAIAVANDLATRLRCDRVSMGVIRRNGSSSPARDFPFRELQGPRPPGRCDRERDGGGDRSTLLGRLSAAARDRTRRDHGPSGACGDRQGARAHR